MAWTQVGNLRGPQGPAGPKGNTGPRGPAGPSGSAAKYYGVLRWSGKPYHPKANDFTRLKSNDRASLVVHKNVGDVAYSDGGVAYLTTPVAGIWLLSATQVWGNAMAPKGCGLGTSPDSGYEGMELWGDFTNATHGVVSRATFLEADTYLYPWTRNGASADMRPEAWGLRSEYSAVLLQPA